MNTMLLTKANSLLIPGMLIPVKHRPNLVVSACFRATRIASYVVFLHLRDCLARDRERNADAFDDFHRKWHA